VSDVARGGPMVEYERRIASGELVDGDNFQVVAPLLNVSFLLVYFPLMFGVRFFLPFFLIIQIDTIQHLQRLYEELVENEEACQLDRYQSSEKSGR
jgi:TRAP-type C4-dicarboxylate transport system permease small subunit